MSESNKRNFIVHGSILAIAGILVRIIGMLYRIPVVNIIGSEGNGIYGAAFNIYNINACVVFVRTANGCIKACVSKIYKEKI